MGWGKKRKEETPEDKVRIRQEIAEKLAEWKKTNEVKKVVAGHREPVVWKSWAKKGRKTNDD